MDQLQITPQLMDAFVKGDAKAFATFYNLHNAALCTFATGLVEIKEDGEDIVKDSFVKLWMKHSDLETPDNVKAFLYITTRNSCLNFLRYQQIKHLHHREEISYHLSNEHVGIDLQRTDQEKLLEIRLQVEKLSPRQKEVFHMSFYEGLQDEIIATLLNISVNTVVRHRGWALHNIRSLIASN